MDYKLEPDLDNITGLSEESSYKYLGEEITMFVVCLLNLCVDILLIYIVFSFGRLRTVSNVLFANWIIGNVCTIIVTPSSYRVICIVAGWSIEFFFLCGILEGLYTFRSVETVFAILVNVNWLSSIFFPRLSEKMKRYYKHIIGITWIIIVLTCTTMFNLCIAGLEESFFGIELIYLIINCVFLITFIISLCTIIVHKCRNTSLDYSVYIAMLTAGFAITNIFEFLVLFHIHPIVITIFLIVQYSNPVTSFVILYIFNSDFKKSFLKIIKRSKINQYHNASFNNRPTNNVIHEVPVQLAFHSPSEELITNEY